MKLDRNSSIAGLPAVTVRDVLRYLGRLSMAVEGFAHRLGIDRAKAETWIADMVKLGWLEPGDYGDDFRVTAKGAGLATAMFIKRISRAKADEIVRDMLDRADGINANPDYVYRIADISAFGSYVTDAPELGDLDLVVTLAFKKEKGGIVEANMARAAASGRQSLSYFERQYFGEIEVQRALKARSPYITFASKATVEELGVELCRIYPRAKKTATA